MCIRDRRCGTRASREIEPHYIFAIVHLARVDKAEAGIESLRAAGGWDIAEQHLCGVGAVSYTHLDVYKRQPSYR